MINAILLSNPDEPSIRRTLIVWLTSHGIKFDRNLPTEELRQLYVKKECGEI